MKTLFIGDVIGKIGRKILRNLLPKTIDYYKIDFVIINGENLAGGFGITRDTSDEMFDLGVDVITSGNHIWDKKVALKLVDESKRILRPANYPPGGKVPGRGAAIYEKNGLSIGVLNLMGRVFMNTYDDPFRCADENLKWMHEKTPLVFVDFHAEATSEKQAMGFHLDGKATALLGTHTHVQTADERVLSNGTAYITDVGMAGPLDSVIGLSMEQALHRFYTQMPVRFMEVPDGDGIMNGVVVEADDRSGKAKSITRISLSLPADKH